MANSPKIGLSHPGRVEVLATWLGLFNRLAHVADSFDRHPIRTKVTHGESGPARYNSGNFYKAIKEKQALNKSHLLKLSLVPLFPILI